MKNCQECKYECWRGSDVDAAEFGDLELQRLARLHEERRKLLEETEAEFDRYQSLVESHVGPLEKTPVTPEDATEPETPTQAAALSYGWHGGLVATIERAVCERTPLVIHGDDWTLELKAPIQPALQNFERDLTSVLPDLLRAAGDAMPF